MITYELLITFEDDQFRDAMDAETEEQALQLAYWNWELAIDITIL